MTEFEKRVRLALLEKDMKLGQFARQTGISLGYLYEIFKGTRKAAAVREKICGQLGIAPEAEAEEKKR